MSDTAPRPESAFAQLIPARAADLGDGQKVLRSLPVRGRRTIGAWCFADQFGPAPLGPAPVIAVGPHPHIGLQTVTWLFDGSIRHRDSLGNDQVIRPGQLNLMTAGNGIAHAELAPPDGDGPPTPGARMAGMQLWIALPEPVRSGPAGFEHHGNLPTVAIDGTQVTVIVGSFGGVHSPATVHTPLVGAQIRFDGDTRVEVPLDPTFEHGLIVAAGSATAAGIPGLLEGSVPPGDLLYLPIGREHLLLRGSPGATAMLIGGRPFGEQVRMFWNFVARTTDELERAASDWAETVAGWETGGGGRFGIVRGSGVAPIPAPVPPWHS